MRIPWINAFFIHLLLKISLESLIIKLLDFSFAARLRKDEPKNCNPLPVIKIMFVPFTLSTSDQIKYRAPEVLKGKGYTEIWAFGALLHTMLHGEGPIVLSEGNIEFLDETEKIQFRFKSNSILLHEVNDCY